MELDDFYELFPEQRDCIDYLEDILWNGVPVCPYCNSKYSTAVLNEGRRHCNTCNTSFSVTVNTIFHKTKADLQKWFLAIDIISDGHKISARGLGQILKVTKDTALKMREAIFGEMVSNPEFINLIKSGYKNNTKTTKFNAN